MAECRILLACWLEFAVDGDFPSGQNEEDALRYVLNRSCADKSNDLDDDDDDEDEETFGHKMKMTIVARMEVMTMNRIMSVIVETHLSHIVLI
jgi:hypothetical protein